MFNGKRRIAGLLAGAAAVLACVPGAAQQQLVQSYALNGYKRVLDGQWEGIRYASDGNVYFGSSTHSAHHGAAFFKYDPRTAQLTLLAEDISRVCGEDPQTNPQGKLHSDIVEANGWLYMSTHFSRDLPGTYISWTGSHVIGYELATGKFRDYGVVHPNYDSYSGIGVDPVRHYIYVFLTGELSGQVSYIYRIDAVTGAKINLGQVGGTFNASQWMFVDRRGDVWFSVANQNGTLRRVRADSGQIDVYPNMLPPLYRWDREQVDGDSVHQNERWIRWMQPLDGDRAVFTLGYYGGMLYLFDATQPIASGLAFRNLKHIGYTDHGLALGDNRVFYYQRANRGYGHQGDQTAEGIRDFHLLSVSLDQAAGYPITDHGLLVDQDGRLVWRLPSMMTNGGNKVFMTGDWWTIPGDLGSLRYRYTNGQEFYDQLPRGEFFAIADAVVPPASGVAVSPRAVTLGQGQSQPFTSSVPSTWTISPVAGSISAAGLYTAPATVTASQAITVTATSVADPSQTGTAIVTLSPPVSVAVTPAQATLGASQTQQFTAAVENTLNKAVSWSLNPATGTISAAGLYTAPAAVASAQTVLVIATSMADGTKSATAAVALIPPLAAITAPTAGQTVSGTITVTAAPTSTITLAAVQFLLDGAALGAEITAAPFTRQLDTGPLANGPHTLAAVGRDAAGNRTTSAAVTVTVNNDRTPPAVSIASPTAGQTVAGRITVTAAASDNTGVAGVQFLLDGAAFGAEITAAPYSTSLDTIPLTNANHTLAAVARDAAGNRTTSAAVTVTVNNSLPVIAWPPLAYWTFDPADTTGNLLLDRSANHASLTAYRTTAIAGKSGGALRFNGVSSYAELVADTHLNLTGDLTIAFWIRTTKSGRNEGVISKYDAAGAESGYLVRTTSSGTLGILIGGDNLPGGNRSIADTVRINDGLWHHAVVVIKLGLGVSFYIDGAPATAASRNIVAARSRQSFNIGRNPFTSYGNYFTGDLDNVRLYNRALTASEAAALYRDGG